MAKRYEEGLRSRRRSNSQQAHEEMYKCTKIQAVQMRTTHGSHLLNLRTAPRSWVGDTKDAGRRGCLLAPAVGSHPQKCGGWQPSGGWLGGQGRPEGQSVPHDKPCLWPRAGCAQRKGNPLPVHTKYHLPAWLLVCGGTSTWRGRFLLVHTGPHWGCRALAFGKPFAQS